MVRTRGMSYVVGLLTLWPPLYLAGFLVWWIVLVAGGRPPSEGGGGVPTWFLVVAALHVATLVLGFVLLAVYVVDAVRNTRLADTDMRVVWVLLIVLVGVGAMPVYWWLHLRPASESFRARSATPRVR